jgi:hypothetical protein
VNDLPELAEVDLLGERWTAAWTGEDDFAGCCSAEVSYEDPLTKLPLSGLADLRARAELLRTAFPDARLERTAPPLIRGDHACVPWKLMGTHRGDVGVLPATDRYLALHGLHYLELADGRVSRARGFFDLYEGATQLGLLPERGGLGEAALLLLRGFGLRR